MNSLLEIKRSIPALGTFFEIKYQEDGRDLSTYITNAFQKVRQLEDILSAHNPQSSLAKFNNNGTVDTKELKTILHISSCLQKKTHNVFNPRNPNTNKIDLGGIAKGFIVDKITKMLTQNNIHGIINAGGDLRIFGKYTAPIHIRNPFNSQEYIFLGNFSNISIASSCITENSKKRGGKSMVWQTSDIVHATVIGKSCTICDALTKVVLINPELAAKCLHSLQYKSTIFDADGNQYTS